MPISSLAARRHSRVLPEIERLRWDLQEARDSISAIRQGSVDALVIDGAAGDRIFTLEGAEHAYRLFVETMNEGAVTIDDEGVVQYSNARFADMIGLPLQDILGASFLSFVTESHHGTFRALLREESDIRREMTLLSPGSGLSIPVLLSSHAILRPQPKYCLVVTDLSELKRAESAERVHWARLRQMISCLPVAVAAVDEQDMVLEVNEQFCRMFDLGQPSDLIGRNRWVFLQKMQEKVRDPEGFLAQVTAMSSVRVPVLDQEVHFRDGRIILRDYVPIFEEGAYRGQLLLYRDVTRDRRIDASKSEFMSLASHQLRSPLTAIRWSFGRLIRMLGGAIPPAAQAMLEEGRHAANRMFDTINTMLSISRVESGSVTVNARSITLKRLLLELVALSSGDIAKRRQSVMVQCAPTVVLRTDQSFLKEILQNLLSNALKYSPDGSTVVLRAVRTADGVRVEVEDQGYGIPAHQQEKIFQKFFRGDNVVEKITDGTGLGLYLVSLLVRTLRGTITFHSRENVGTTFTLFFPSFP